MRATIGSIYRWFMTIRLRSIVLCIIYNCNTSFNYYIYFNIFSSIAFTFASITIFCVLFVIYNCNAGFNYYIHCNICLSITVTFVSIIIFVVLFFLSITVTLLSIIKFIVIFLRSHAWRFPLREQKLFALLEYHISPISFRGFLFLHFLHSILWIIACRFVLFFSNVFK